MTSCACDTSKTVCLAPGENSVLLTQASPGRICIGRIAYPFILPDIPDGTTGLNATDPGLRMETWEPGRLHAIVLDPALTALGSGFGPREFFYRGNTWFPKTPDTSQLGKTNYPAWSFGCDDYARCWGNVLPKACLPVFHKNDDFGLLTFANTTGGPVVGASGIAIVDHGFAPSIKQGECYVDAPQIGTGTMPGGMGVGMGDVPTVGFEERPGKAPTLVLGFRGMKFNIPAVP